MGNEPSAPVQRDPVAVECDHLRHVAECASVIYGDGAVKAVREALSSMKRFGSPAVQLHGCWALAKLIAQSYDAKVELEKLQGYTAIINAMKYNSADSRVQGYGCEALSHIATNCDKAIIQCGGAQAVANAMRSFPSDKDVQHFGCSVLHDIIGHGSQAALTIDDIEALIVHAMRSFPSDERIAYFACVLFNGKVSKQRAGKAGAIEAIVGAMNTLTADTSIISWGPWALADLCRDAPNHQAIAGRAGAIEAILAVMGRSAWKEVAEHGCQALMFIASLPDNRASLAKSGAVRAVVKALNAHLDTSNIQSYGCSFLAYMATDPSNQALVLQEGGLKAVINSAGHAENYGGQTEACEALKNLCANDSNIAPIIDAGGIGAIVRFVQKYSYDEKAITIGCPLLIKLAAPKKSLVGAAGGVDAILKAMQGEKPAKSANVQEWACKALMELSSDEVCRLKLATAGGIDVIIKTMTSFAANASVQEHGSAVLANVSATPNHQALVVKAGGIPAALGAMRAHSTAAVQLNGCKVLMNSPFHAYADIVKEGGIEAITTAMQSHPSDQEIQQCACQTLLNLSANADILAAMLHTKGVKEAVESAHDALAASNSSGAGIAADIAKKFAAPAQPEPTPQPPAPQQQQQQPEPEHPKYSNSDSRIRNDLAQVRYVGVLKLVAGYNPPFSCREHMLSDLPGVLDGVTQVALIVEESAQIAESCLQHLKSGIPKLPPDEALAIVAYTYDLGFNSEDPDGEGKDNLYHALNSTLRERAPAKMSKLKPFLAYLMRGLAALPALEATTYRGVPATAADVVRDNYRTGTTVHWSAFTSTTSSLPEAEKFASQQGPGGVIFRMKCLQGRNVAAYSAIPRESEVILSPNSRFVVTEGLHDGGGDGFFLFVDMVEMRSEGFTF